MRSVKIKLMFNGEEFEQNKNKLKFNYTIQNVTKGGLLNVQLKFENPTAVSMSNPQDQLKIRVVESVSKKGKPKYSPWYTVFIPTLDPDDENLLNTH